VTFGALVSNLRSERGWTQRELAEKLEMHPNHVSRMEKNRMRPRRSTVEKVAEVFELEVDDVQATVDADESEDHPLLPQLASEDPELAHLLGKVPQLDEDQRQALRVFLRSMLTCQQLQKLANGKNFSLAS